MSKVVLQRLQRASYELPIEDKHKAIASAMLGNEDWTPIEVDDEPVVGRCENCQQWLLESDHYSVDEDMIRLCKACWESMEHEESEVT